MNSDAWPTYPEHRAGLLRIAFVAVGAYVALLSAWRVREMSLLAFASVVAAVLPLAAAGPVERRAGLSRTRSLSLA